MSFALRLVALCIAAVAFGRASYAEPLSLAATTAQPAVDGIFAAFKTHPIVELGDAHHLLQEGRLYVALISDPRFAEDVRNVVVESGSAIHQGLIDRYENGETVPYEQLRLVWTDTVGAEIPWSQMYSNFFAVVRQVNSHLSPEKRIHVWLGEPPIDWSKVKSFADVDPFMVQRDSYPARLIEREILSKGRKALVIYGPNHFLFSPMAEPINMIIERRYPGAIYLVLPYVGYRRESCNTTFQSHMRDWPTPAIAGPVRGTWIGDSMSECADDPQFRSVEHPEKTAEARVAFIGLRADAILYLGPLDTLVHDAAQPDLYLDSTYLENYNHRLACCLNPTPLIDPQVILHDNVVGLRRYDPYNY